MPLPLWMERNTDPQHTNSLFQSERSKPQALNIRNVAPPTSQKQAGYFTRIAQLTLVEILAENFD
ncbi:MAG: hypothetical protein H8E42_08455 [Nitrospinae bacterium]|nr:hypothetical protein [Nitrospinota bacterium]MBL7020330.1 hypothetical protein [Nitrospinaceae bacterium]